MSFKELTDNIVALHHSFLRRELPDITSRLENLSVELEASEKITEAQNLFRKIRNKIEAHLKDEETLLFPTGSALELGEIPPESDIDLLERLVEMEKEHENCGNALRLLSQMLMDMPVSTIQAKVLDSVRNLSCDMDEHVRKENEEVHPRFLALMKARSSQAAGCG